MPIATTAIVVVTALAFVWELVLLLGGGEEVWYDFIRAWGLTPLDLVNAEGWRGLTAITSMFLHGGLSHIFFNLLYLWVFGPQVEDLTGSWGFFFFYLLCGLAGSALTVLLDARSDVPGIGASGAIAGVMGAYLLLHPGQRVRTFIFIGIPLIPRLPAWILLVLWILEQAILGQIVLTFGENFTGVGVWAHIGGFAGGLAFVYLFLRKEVVFNRESVFRLRR